MYTMQHEESGQLTEYSTISLILNGSWQLTFEESHKKHR